MLIFTLCNIAQASVRHPLSIVSTMAKSCSNNNNHIIVWLISWTVSFMWTKKLNNFGWTAQLLFKAKSLYIELNLEANLIKSFQVVQNFEPIQTYLYLSKAIWTYQNLSQPFWTNPNLSKRCQTYPNLSEPVPNSQNLSEPTQSIQINPIGFKKMINQKCQNCNLQYNLVRTFWGVSHSEYTAQYSRHKLKIVLLQSLSWPFMLLQHGGGVASLGPQ